MGRLLDKYRLAMEGDALRKYAKAQDIFIFPYDLQSGADIALYENTEAKQEAQRYVVFSLEEVRPRHGKSGLHELPETCDMGSNFRAQGAGNAAGAIGQWNKRMQERTQKLQKPFFHRFICFELDNIILNAVFFGFLYYLIGAALPALDGLLREYAWPVIVVLICLNFENLFTKSYGEEIPRETLNAWSDAPTEKFSEEFYQQTMAQWQEVRERHERSLPIYLLWRRHLREPKAESLPEMAVKAPEDAGENGAEEQDYQLYCREITAKLQEQMEEIKALKTKIADRNLKRYTEDVLEILQEIRETLYVGEIVPKVIAARKVVSYWNMETISLLMNYLTLWKNSSREAEEMRESIVDALHDLSAVYRKELGRITATQTVEMKASLEVLQREIEETLDRKN